MLEDVKEEIWLRSDYMEHLAIILGDEAQDKKAGRKEENVKEEEE